MPNQLIVKTTRPELPAKALEVLKGKQLGRMANLNLSLIELSDTDVRGAIGRLKGLPGVAYAEPNYYVHLQATPNDPRYKDQWAYTASKLNGVAAWDAYDSYVGANRPAGAIVALIDSGIDQNHEDIEKTHSTAAPMTGKILVDKNFSSSTTHDDKNSHGTHVAGIIGALTNNALGVAGTHRDARLYNLKIFGDTGTTDTWRTVQAIDYARTGDPANNVPPANIISMSWGLYTDVQVYREALAKAQQAGLLLIAAAGNDNKSTKFYPAAYDGEPVTYLDTDGTTVTVNLDVVAVGATNSSDARAYFSNYGNWVDVMAPGDKIMSTMPNHRTGLFNPTNYGSKSGTSMAAPFVAGQAALLWAKYGNAADVKARIQGYTDRDFINNSVNENGVLVPWSKYGRIELLNSFGQ